MTTDEVLKYRVVSNNGTTCLAIPDGSNVKCLCLNQTERQAQYVRMKGQTLGEFIDTLPDISRVLTTSGQTACDIALNEYLKPKVWKVKPNNRAADKSRPVYVNGKVVDRADEGSPCGGQVAGKAIYWREATGRKGTKGQAVCE